MCDKKINVTFKSSICSVACPITNDIIFNEYRNKNIYVVDLDNINISKQQCLVANNANNNKSFWLWHRRLAHANMDLISKLSRKNLVRGLPKLKYEINQICKACQIEKQVRSSFKPKNAITSSKPLEILHMDLFRPSRTTSLGGKLYGLVIIDDYSRFTWVSFLFHKNDTLSVFSKLCRQISNEKNLRTIKIRSDHGTEYENQDSDKFYTKNEIDHNFFVPRTSQ